MTQSPEQIIEEIKSSPINKVKVAITDMDGVLRGKYIHKDKFLSAADGGFGFCNVVFGWDCADVCYDNSKYTGWHTGYPDAIAQIDLNTYRRVPWDDNIPFFLADFKDGDEPLELCPRQVLKKVLRDLEAEGYSVMAGLEFEFFNFLESAASAHEKQFTNLTPLTPGMFGYSLLRASQNQPFFSAMMDELPAFGVPLEGLHTETGPGVLEAALAVSDALTAADRGVLFKAAVKEIAHRFGILPTFMAKISPELPGCSGHIHHSLWRTDGSGNAFYDRESPDGFSDTFKHFIAGQLHCLPQFLPLLAPTINSYKRLVEGMWAPTRMTWSSDNRTSALRAIGGSPKSTRLETRVSGADMNPYLALAGLLAAGLYGIKNKLAAPDPVKGNAYEVKDVAILPRNLEEAAQVMLKSEVARALFGEVFVEHMAQSRIWEWRQFSQAVTNWELQRYFEII